MAHVRKSVALVLAVAAGSVAPEARADRIKLRGGGEIKGVVVTDPTAKSDLVLVQTETGAKPVSFSKGAVLGVVRESGPLDDYVHQRGSVAATAQAHYDFGLWCEEVKLTGPAEAEYRKALEFDPEFGPAHKKLGHVQHGTRWITYDEQRAAQGLVKYKGKWISKAEKERIDAAAAASAEQSSWASRLKLLRRKLYDQDPAERESAEEQIAAIRDPAAIPGLLRAFGADGDAVRVRLGQLIAAIPGPEATEAMVNLVVAEKNLDVRQTMLDELARRHDPATVARLQSVLKGKDPDVVGRAAWALAMLKSVDSVPKLVDALIQSEKRIVMMPVIEPSGGGAGGLSGSYGFAQNVSPGMGLPAGGHAISSGGTASSAGPVSSGGSPGPAASGGAPGMSTVGSQPVISGVATAPGVIAFGVGSVPVPAGSNPMMQGGPQQVGAMPAKVTVKLQNHAVLKALESLTGVNYGFDQPAWKKWIGSSFKVEPEAPRRVPKP